MHLCCRLTTTQDLTSGRCGVAVLQNGDVVASTPPVPAARHTRSRSLQWRTHTVNAAAPGDSVGQGRQHACQRGQQGAHLARSTAGCASCAWAFMHSVHQQTQPCSCINKLHASKLCSSALCRHTRHHLQPAPTERNGSACSVPRQRPQRGHKCTVGRRATRAVKTLGSALMHSQFCNHTGVHAAAPSAAHAELLAAQSSCAREFSSQQTPPANPARAQLCTSQGSQLVPAVHCRMRNMQQLTQPAQGVHKPPEA